MDENTLNQEMITQSYNLPENRSYFSKIGFLYFLTTVLVFLSQIYIPKGLKMIAPDFVEKNLFIVMMLSMYVVALPLGFFLITRIKTTTKIEKHKMSIKQLIGFFFVSYATLYLSNIIGNILIQIISKIKGREVINAISDIATTNQVWVNILIMVICAPIFEEILFRKLLIDRTVRYGDKFAILMSGLFFGLYHGNLYQFFYAFSLGCIFAYIYLKTGNVIYTILLHMCINFLGSVVAVWISSKSGIMELLEALSGGNSDMSNVFDMITNNVSGILLFIFYLIVLFAVVISGIVLFILNIKKIDLNQGELNIPKGKKFKTVFLNLGMGLFLLFWIYYLIYATII